MSHPTSTRLGGCRCSAVRFALTGQPMRVGLCHCKTCRKETGSVAMAYAVWDTAQFTKGGETRTWEGRDFCPRCGTRLFALREEEHAPSGLVPTEETWTQRREAWLAPVAGAKQYVEDVVEERPSEKPTGRPTGKRPAAPKRVPPQGDEGEPAGTGTPLASRKRAPSSGQSGAKKG
jgi:hypothetical protein